MKKTLNIEEEIYNRAAVAADLLDVTLVSFAGRALEAHIKYLDMEKDVNAILKKKAEHKEVA